MVKRALTIAGSDSSGGAGIQADLKTFTVFGVYGMSVITALTAQNTVAINGIYDVTPEFVLLQLESVLSDIGADGIKTGMLSNTDIIKTVAAFLRKYPKPVLVVDPVMVAKGGQPLLHPDAVTALKQELISMAFLATPNIPEAQILSGIRIETDEDMKKAAKIIRLLGCTAVLIKGGHRLGNASDLLYDGNEFTHFTTERINNKNTHGTGCTYSAAILSNLVLGKSLIEAIRLSKAYVTDAIRHALPLGRGIGPLNHSVALKPNSLEYS